MINLIHVFAVLAQLAIFLFDSCCQGSGPNASNEKICGLFVLNADAGAIKHTRACHRGRTDHR